MHISNEFEAKGVGFSAGELQKIALARSHVSKIDILILDEPYSFSDVYSKAEINGILKDISLIDRLLKTKELYLLYMILQGAIQIYLFRDNEEKATELFKEFLDLQATINIYPHILKKDRQIVQGMFDSGMIQIYQKTKP